MIYLGCVDSKERPGQESRRGRFILIGDRVRRGYTLPMAASARTIMMRRLCAGLLILGALTLSSCERAHRYGAAPKKAEPKDEEKTTPASKGPYRLTWHEPHRVERDLPIIFVPDSSPEWADLKSFWNVFPSPGAIVAASFGADAVSAMAALVVIDHHASVKIKVPRGLPDPTEHIPADNPPTFGKWQLGQALFHERLLPAGPSSYACADCHRPVKGFTTDREKDSSIKINTLSLINVVYNRRQFWDGRVETLEETLVRGMDENAVLTQEQALEQHNFPGFVSKLVARKTHDRAFEEAFGVEHPTQDTIARALATYMRTILSGDSLYDRADKIRKDKKAKALSEEHFLELLKDEIILKELPEDDKNYTREQMAAKLVEGENLFRIKGRCAACHAGPLFTDGDSHNVGYRGDLAEPVRGVETGRALRVPVGRKESRLIGAFRTPSLRNLANTGPYFHDGSYYRLMEVVEFFDEQIVENTTHLAAALKDGERPRRLKLTPNEKEALVLFLRALEGTPVDRTVVEMPKW
jgi:cytochrome c peroxidase